MTGVATTELGLASTAIANNNGGGFDVFSSLRDGTVGEDFSSGVDEGRGADADEAASGLDLVAVAGGEEELDTFTDDSIDLKDMPAPVDALSLAGKSEINSPENRMSDERRAAICQGVASAACASCAARDDCPILRMRNFANENLQPAPERESYLRDLLNDDDDGIVVAGYANPDSGADLTNADITETSDDKTDKLIEQVAPPNQGNEIPTSETTESPDELADIKEAEQPFLEPAIATEDVDEIREAQPENVSEASVNTSGEEYFTEPTEENRPSIKIKQQTFDVISGASDKKNQQPAFESSDIPTQTEMRTVPPSPAVSEDTQTGDENRNSLKNETAYHTASDDKDTASVVENTYDGDKTTAPSSVKTPSIERQKENNFVTAGSKSANSEPSRVAENDESATPVSEQQHLAAQFEAVKSGESTIAEPVDNSNMKSPKSTQRSEVKLEAVTAYNDLTRSSDYIEGKQPEELVLDIGSIPSPQERMTTASVPSRYDENETYRSPDNYYVDQFDETPKVDNELTAIQVIDYSFSKVEEAVGSKQKIVDTERYENAVGFYRPQAEPVLSQTQISVENNKESLAIGSHANFDNNLVQLKIDNAEADIFVADDVINTTSKTDAPVKLEIRDNISPVKQLDYDDAAVEYCYDKAWAEEGMVFFVEQQEPSAAELEALSTETMTVVSSIEAVALPMETITVCEEADNLETSVDDETEIASVKQLDNFKPALVPETAKGDYEPEEQIAITTSLATELIPDVELDEPAVEILEERIMPREEHDNMTVKTSEKSDLLRVDAEVETITMDTSGIKSAVDLSEEQEEPTFLNKLDGESESEAGKQTDLAVASAVDSYSYNSGTSAVSDNVLVVKSCPSSGLWSDDSRLNPEEESASTAQSSADDASLVSRLVGMFVVAICVVRGRQPVKV